MKAVMNVHTILMDSVVVKVVLQGETATDVRMDILDMDRMQKLDAKVGLNTKSTLLSRHLITNHHTKKCCVSNSSYSEVPIT